MDAEVQREFIREMTLRIERALREFSQQASRDRNVYLARFEKLEAGMSQLEAESRAQTQALLRALDRLDGGGAAPA